MTRVDAWHRSRAPVARLDTLRDALERYWGFSGALSPLYGERDLNLELLTDDGGRWLLKVAHQDTPLERLRFEGHVLRGLPRQARSPVTPVLLPTPDGRDLVPVTLDSGVKTHLRILGWIPGEPLEPSTAPHGTLEALGRASARLNEALAAQELPGARTLPGDLPWDLQNLLTLAPLLDRCPPVVPRQAVRDTLERFRAHVARPLAALPRQVVHNDLNPDNLRIDPQRPTSLPGVIDFGDMVRAPVICDLAIACAYVVGQEADRCLDRVASALRGFHQTRPIEETEWRLLPTLLEGRLCQSLLIQGARIRDGHPDADNLAESLRGHAHRLRALQALPGDRYRRLRADALAGLEAPDAPTE